MDWINKCHRRRQTIPTLITVCLVSVVLSTIWWPCSFQTVSRGHVLVFFNRHCSTMNLVKEKQGGLQSLRAPRDGHSISSSTPDSCILMAQSIVKRCLMCSLMSLFFVLIFFPTSDWSWACKMDKKIISLAEENSVGELVELLLTIDNEEVCFQGIFCPSLGAKFQPHSQS